MRISVQSPPPLLPTTNATVSPAPGASAAPATPSAPIPPPGEPQQPVARALNRAGLCSMAQNVSQTRGVRYTAKALKIGFKAYVGFVAVNSAILIGKNPGDVKANPQGILGEGCLLGTPRADLKTVQETNVELLEKYGEWIKPEICVDPVIRFEHQPQINGKAFAGVFRPDRPNSGSIILHTYDSNLEQTAAHEYLHCFSQPFYATLLSVDGITPEHARQINEGITQLLTLQMNIKSGFPLAEKSVYSSEVKLAKKIENDMGGDALKKAYLSYDPAAITQLVYFALQHLEG